MRMKLDAKNIAGLALDDGKCEEFFWDLEMPGYATDRDDPTEMPRWGKIGKQRIDDEGPLPPFPNMSNVPNMHDLPFLKAKYDMTTFDEVLVKTSSDFMDKAKRDNKPFFVWHNTTRMHVWTFLSEKYKSMRVLASEDSRWPLPPI
jgi:hypothetical protein